MAQSCHPICQRVLNAQEEHDASGSAAIVALDLISSARLLLKLDDVYTEYSAQYLVENALPKKEDGHGEMDELTVIDCLKFALQEGIPKAGNWAHLGCLFKPPPFASHIPRVSTKGKVIETKDLEEALELVQHQPVGARLHVFIPDIDRVGDGIYVGTKFGGGYMGLRDVIICGVVKEEGETVAEVKICYKKKTTFMKVSLTETFLAVPLNGDESRAIAQTGLLVDFCSPRLSIN